MKNKMKSTILMLCVVFSFTSITTIAQNTYTNTYNNVRISKNNVIPTFTVYSENTFTKNSKWGYNMFALVMKDWAEAYPSIFYKVTSRDIISIGVGIETASPYWRLGASYIHFPSKNRGFLNQLLLKGIVEYGGGSKNYWYNASVDYQTKNFRVGIMSARFYGTGPRIEYQKSQTKFKIGFAELYDTEFKTLNHTIFVGYDF